VTNHIDTYLRVTGPQDHLEAFKSLMIRPVEHGGVHFDGGTMQFDFGTILPEPQRDRNDDAGYQWRMSHWGTMSNCYYCYALSERPGEISIAFSTAWSFPYPVMAALATRFPSLIFTCRWCDPAGGAGVSDIGADIVYEAGVLKKHQEFSREILWED
jgi:hypothetical protein